MGALCAWAWRALREWAHYACVMGVRSNDGERWRKLGGLFVVSTLAIKKGVNGKMDRKNF